MPEVQRKDATGFAVYSSWRESIAECGYPANAGQETLVVEMLTNTNAAFEIEYTIFDEFPGFFVIVDVYSYIYTQTSADEAIESYISEYISSFKKFDSQVKSLTGFYTTEEDFTEALADIIENVFEEIF